MSKEIFDFVSIQLNKNHKTALYVQLYDEIREMIISGKLSHGFLLPPVRKLAKFLEINAGTVMSAYKLLEQNGYIFIFLRVTDKRFNRFCTLSNK